MKLNNRITLYMFFLIILVMVIQPCLFAQGGGRGGRGGDRGDMMGGGGPGGERDMMGGGGRGGDRDMRGGRGGPGRGGFPFQEEAVTDAQIDRIIKMYSTRHSPQELKTLEDQRKSMNRDQFVMLLRNTAFWETAEVMREEREYRGILEWCEKFTPDEAKGIRETKDENFDLYKKRLDSLRNKYRSLYDRPRTSDALMHVLVLDLQLNNKERDLAWQYWNPATDAAKKESILTDLKEVVSNKYDNNVKRREIQYQEIQKEIERLQQMVVSQMNEVNTWKDPTVRENEIQRQINNYKEPRTNRRGMTFGPPSFFPPVVPMPGTNTMQGPNSISEPNK